MVARVEVLQGPLDRSQSRERELVRRLGIEAEQKRAKGVIEHAQHEGDSRRARLYFRRTERSSGIGVQIAFSSVQTLAA
jgi:hypothetical protein